MIRYIVFLLLMASPASAQSPVITQPYAVQSTNASSTIASTNTFQSIWLANPISPNSKKRASCTIQNNGSNNMFVFFGPIASAVTTSSFTVTPGQPIYCNIGGNGLQDQVSITGTSGDAFTAAQQ